MNNAEIRVAALRVLESAWRPDRGYCWPNADVYPHLWLWDSCFHSIAWASLDDARAVVELEHVLGKQFPNGFLPHMVYGPPTAGKPASYEIFRGPRKDVSCFTQPPVCALAMAWAGKHGIPLPDAVTQKVQRGLSYFLRRRFRDGLAFVVHPWETGCDDSPRWDSWYGETWDQRRWSERDLELVRSAEFDPEADDAIWNSQFVCSPSLFNAILSHAFFLVSERTGDRGLRDTSFDIGAAMDDLLWDDSQAMYVDRPLAGGGASCTIPVLDGVLSALGSVSRDHARACLEQLRDPSRFAAPWGLRYLPPAHPRYQPDSYWRGPAWPQLTFLAVQACRRWQFDDLATQLSEQGKRGIAQAGWSEYWNPETGRGLGARPQTWAALAAAM
jgi:mannosylglycerate hydrolase MGH1-like protein